MNARTYNQELSDFEDEFTATDMPTQCFLGSNQETWPQRTVHPGPYPSLTRSRSYANANTVHLSIDIDEAEIAALIQPCDLDMDLEMDLDRTPTSNARPEIPLDPFFGLPEPLQIDPGTYPTARYSSEWTPIEDETLLSFRAANSNLEWDALVTHWQASYGALFPRRELSDMLSRWRFLSELHHLSSHDRMTIWVYRNGSVPPGWSDLQVELQKRGKYIDIPVLIDEEKQWGRRLNISGLGFKWPQPEPQTLASGTDADLGVLWEEHRATMEAQIEREHELIFAMHQESYLDAYQIACHYEDGGVRWDDDLIWEVLEQCADDPSKMVALLATMNVDLVN